MPPAGRAGGVVVSASPPASRPRAGRAWDRSRLAGGIRLLTRRAGFGDCYRHRISPRSQRRSSGPRRW